MNELRALYLDAFWSGREEPDYLDDIPLPSIIYGMELAIPEGDEPGSVRVDCDLVLMLAQTEIFLVQFGNSAILESAPLLKKLLEHRSSVATDNLDFPFEN